MSKGLFEESQEHRDDNARLECLTKAYEEDYVHWQRQHNNVLRRY